jgi:hypothetical protein
VHPSTVTRRILGVGIASLDLLNEVDAYPVTNAVDPGWMG